MTKPQINLAPVVFCKSQRRVHPQCCLIAQVYGQNHALCARRPRLDQSKACQLCSQSFTPRSWHQTHVEQLPGSPFLCGCGDEHPYRTFVEFRQPPPLQLAARHRLISRNDLVRRPDTVEFGAVTRSFVAIKQHRLEFLPVTHGVCMQLQPGSSLAKVYWLGPGFVEVK